MELPFPQAWLGQIVQPAPVESVAEVDACIAAALAAPVGSPPLAACARPGQQVAIIVDDATRKTPAAAIVRQLVVELAHAGVRRADIAIVVALGTHRAMTADELATKLGTDILQRYRVINAPCTDAQELVDLGEAPGGIPTHVNRTVADADLRIGVGMITPHLDAGWSGGAKIVLPGVCGLVTVDAFHRASAFVAADQLGEVDALMRRTLEHFVAEQVPLHFIVNVVLTLAGDLYACVAGHAVAAHRAGVRHARAVYAAAAPRRFPVVVADCAPYDVDLWQSIKGAWAGAQLVEPGGTLVLVTAAPEGVSNYPLVPVYAGQAPDELRNAIVRGTVEDAMQAATGVMWGMLLQRMRIVFVSPGLRAADAAVMGAGWQPDLATAVAEAVARLPEAVRPGAVAVIPQAGLVLPVLAGAPPI
jgi:nickel-dependent lactate racemase